MSQTDVILDEKIKHITKEPSKYSVVALNDDVTPIDWVINLLMKVFRHNKQSAEELTMCIHHEGSAVVGTYDYEVAEQKAADAINLSRDAGFPLGFDLEESIWQF